MRLRASFLGHLYTERILVCLVIFSLIVVNNLENVIVYQLSYKKKH